MNSNFFHEFVRAWPMARMAGMPGMAGMGNMIMRSASRATRGGWGVWPIAGWAFATVLVLATALGAQQESEPTLDRTLRFMRVHVPRGKLADVPLGQSRYVPMSVQEFETAVARLSVVERADTLAGAIQSLADGSRYSVVVHSDGSLTGRVSFDVGGQKGLLPREMPLGTLAVQRATVKTAAGTGAAVVYCRRDGTTVLRTPEPGTYACEWRGDAPKQTVGGPAYTVPLVPAIFSVIHLRLPHGLRPVVAGSESQRVFVFESVEADSATVWRIDVGPIRTLDLRVVRDGCGPPTLSLWSDLSLSGCQLSLGVTVHPATPWNTGAIVLEKDPSITVLRVGMLGGSQQSGRNAEPGSQLEQDLLWSSTSDGRTIQIVLPAWSAGTQSALVIDGIAPFVPHEVQALPRMRVPPSLWASGGAVVRVDTSLSLSHIGLEGCLAVTPEVAARWPIAATHRGRSTLEAERWADTLSARVRPASVHIEDQGPRSSISVAVEPREAELNVARVTTVDVAPGSVLGRTACDIQVDRGEAFHVSARITRGWFIDSVEAVEWPQATDGIATAVHREPVASADPPEWKVMQGGDLLWIGLRVAATPTRSVGLRIRGHRDPVAIDESFSSSEMDMLRLDGERDGLVRVAFQTSPESTIEFTTGKQELEISDPRLAMLVEEGSARAWMANGPAGLAWQGRLVRRRPPLDVRAQVRLTVRDDRLTEAFTFECRPDTSDLDAMVVHFSEPMDDRLEWSLMPSAESALAGRSLVVRPLERPAPRGGEADVQSPAESWMVELMPAVRVPVTIRAVRTIPFVAAVPVPLAWVEGAARQAGEVIVRDSGRNRPQVLNRRLAELPPQSFDSEQSLAMIADLSFNVTPELLADSVPAAELIPGGLFANDDARAWAWSETTSCWCHVSGLTEYETLFEIENHGRSSVSLSLPDGKRVQGIFLNGVRVSFDTQAIEGAISIELPVGRRFGQLLVRSIAHRNPGWGLWGIAPTGGSLDVPVLERTWRVLLPPELEIFAESSSHRAVNVHASPGWTTRLLNATLRPPGNQSQIQETVNAATAAASLAKPSRPGPLLPARASGDSTSLVDGFVAHWFVPDSGQIGSSEIVVGRASLIDGAAILAAVIVAAGSIGVSRGRVWLTLIICLMAAVIALWVASPYDAIARSAWWGSVVAVWLVNRWTRISARAARAMVVVASMLAMTASHAHAQGVAKPVDALVPDGGLSAPDTLRVFVLPGERGETKQGATAMVPERLFRLLAQAVDTPSAPETVRVLESRVLVGQRSAQNVFGGVWKMSLDIDADGGSSLVLDQTPCNARWIATTVQLDGRPLAVRSEADGRMIRVVVPSSGRHRLEVEVEPAGMRSGEVETARACIPVAPTASVEFLESREDGTAAGFVCCECAPLRGVFLGAKRQPIDSRQSASRGSVRYDVSQSAEVRLVRSCDPRGTFVETVRVIESRNDIVWDLDACRVTATYAIDSGDEIIRSVIVRADPRLEQIEEVDSELLVHPLGGQRFQVEFRRPMRGPVRMTVPFRMDLVDPVGVFDVPEAWLEGVASDRRTTRLVPSPDLAVQVMLRDGVLSPTPSDTDAFIPTHSWRVELPRGENSNVQSGSIASVPEEMKRPFFDREPPVRVTVERKVHAIRSTQNLAIGFESDRIRFELRARLDASSTALLTIPLEVPTDCVIDRINLFEDDVVPLTHADRGAIDLRWSRSAANRVVAVLQRPRAGWFRLNVVAHLPGKPVAAGTLPLLRTAMDSPLSQAGSAPPASPLVVSWTATDAMSVNVSQAASSGVDEHPGEKSHSIEIFAEQAPSYTLNDDVAVGRDSIRPLVLDTNGSIQRPAAASDGNASGARVEFAEIHLTIDERGRAWGIARFDFVALEPVVLFKIPRGMRLFEVYVDGHAVGHTVSSGPQQENVAKVRLLDVRWPRSLVAVFAGDVGPQFVDGEPFQLESPAMIGMPCTREIWALKAPWGVSLRITEPAEVLDAGVVVSERRAALTRLDGDFERAAVGADPSERTRLAEYLRFRREQATVPLERAWWSTLSPQAQAASESLKTPVCVGMAPFKKSLTIRGVRDRDPTVPTRAIATLTILAMCTGVWVYVRRRPSEGWQVTLWGVPIVVAIVGIVWMLVLDPAWPGVCFIAYAIASALNQWLRSVPQFIQIDSSITQIAPSPVAPTASFSSR